MNNLTLENLLEMTDEELILVFQRENDPRTFNQLCIRYKDKLKNFLFRFTNDMKEAEDLTQDTLFKVYKKKDSYKEIAKFSTWMYTIAANLARTELRKRKRRKTDNISHIGKDDREFIIVDTIAEDIEESQSQHSANKMIQESISILDEEFRIIVLMRDIQELSYEEISKILEIPLGTVKSRINRARLKLRGILEEKGVRRY